MSPLSQLLDRRATLERAKRAEDALVQYHQAALARHTEKALWLANEIDAIDEQLDEQVRHPHREWSPEYEVERRENRERVTRAGS